MYKNIKDVLPPLLSADMIGKPFLLAENSLRTIDWGKTFQFINDYSVSTKELTTLEELHPDVGIYHVKNVLSDAQCAEIIDKSSYLDLQPVKYGNGRNNSRLVVFDKSFADILWKTIKQKCVDTFPVEHTQPFGFDVSRGDWKLSGINEAMRLNKYDSANREFFGLHRDSQFCPTGDKRSVYTILLYLNDDFNGGETRFYFPKDPNIDCRKLTMNEEVMKNGGLDDGYDSLIFTPVRGDAVIFKQNIIHQGIVLTGESKYVIKTDIIAERIGEKFGFSIIEEEQADYLECLELFRKAQQAELNNTDDKNCKIVSDYYEQCLSIRYSYPNMLKEVTIKSAEGENKNQEESWKEEVQDVKREDDLKEKVSISPFSLFPREVWFIIMNSLTDYSTLVNLIVVFPDLVAEKKKLDQLKVIPKILHHSGVFTKFVFPKSSFVYANMKSCARVAAVYSIYLLGNVKGNDSYTVKYDRDSKEVTTVELEDLLIGAFYEDTVKGPIFKVKQQKEKKDPTKDMFQSVDRRFMATYFDHENFGIDIQSELRANFNVIEDVIRTGDDYTPYTEIFSLYKNFGGKVYSDEQRRTLFNAWDRIYELHKNDLPREGSLTDAQTKECTTFECADDITMKLITNWLGQCYENYEISNESPKMYLSKLTRSSESDEYKTFTDKYYKSDDTSDDSENKIPKISTEESCIGATVLRKVTEPVTIQRYDYCICGLGDIAGTISNKCETSTFNHLIVDFGKHELVVDIACRHEPCLMFLFLQRRMQELFPTGFDFEFLSVDIKNLKDIISSFNHASCMCVFPEEYELNEYVNLSSYPFLNHIHVGFARDQIDCDILFVYTCYGGIVAL